MRQLPNFGDERTLLYCAFCGGRTGTRDHCPSRVFLDKPYPENLPVVPACSDCNTGFSADEEYLACLLACVVAGTTTPGGISREKVQRILAAKPALQSRIEKSQRTTDGTTIFEPEHKRVKPILTKLAQGHALYELHESCARPADKIQYYPIAKLNNAERLAFENPEQFSVWPEVGSRAMQRIVEESSDVTPNGWIKVQKGRYRYVARCNEDIEIRIVLEEYLACWVCWYS